MKEVLRRFSFEEGLLLEARLNEIKFLGVPSGSLLSYQISTAADVGYPSGLKQNFLQRLIFLKYYFKFIRQSEIKTSEIKPLENSSVLLGLSANQNRLISWILPIYQIFDSKEVVVVSKDQLPNDSLMRQIPLNSFSLTSEEEVIWKNEILKCLPKLKNELNINVPKVFNRSFQFQIILNYFFQTRLVLASNRILSQTKPKLILVDHDRQPWNSALVLCSKIKKIPTYSLIHGLTLPITVYAPVIADNLLCWGEFHRKQFNKYLNPQHLIDIGNFKISEIVENKPESLMQLGRKPRIIFASTNFQFDQKVKLARLFLEASSELKNVEIFFRLHPSESIDDYHFLKEEFSFCQIMSSIDMSSEDSFKFGDIFVGHNSQYLVEAYYSKLPIIVFSPPEITIPIGIFDEIVKFEKMEIITNDVGLVKMVSDIIENGQDKVKNSAYFCSSIGLESINSLKRLLITVLQNE